jgi:hypothetical protein
LSEARTFLDALMGAVLDAMAPLEDALADPVLLQDLLEELGWVLDPGPVTPAELRARIPIGDLVATLRATTESLRTGNATPQLYSELVKGTSDLVALLAGLGAGSALPALPAPLSEQTFWESLAVDLVGYLIVRQLRATRPTLHAVLHLTGVIDFSPADVAEHRLDGHRRVVMRWDRLGHLVGNPGALFAEVYGWGGTFAHGELLERLRVCLRVLGLWPAAVESDGNTLETYYGSASAREAPNHELRIVLAAGTTEDGVHTETGLSVLAIPSRNGVASPPAGLLVSLYAEGDAKAAIPITENVTLAVAGVIDAERLVGLELRPDGAGFADTTAVEAHTAITLTYRPSEPMMLFGGREGSRAQLAGVVVGLGAEAGTAGFDVSIRADLAGLHLVIALADADAFIGGLLGSGELSLAADLAVIWSRRDGLHVDGQAGLRLELPLTLALGPVTVQQLVLEAGVEKSSLAVTAAVTAAGKLGPLAVTVDGIGVVLRFTPDTSGVIAGLDPSIAFRPPKGVGLLIEGPTVFGGGFLLFDEVRQEYAGIVQLELANLALSAIGLITTRPGEFSLLVIISVEFSPIQLGYGFTLNGVGGLLAVNRSININAIEDGLSQGALDTILFPHDPVRNAPQLITALNKYFPPTQGQYVFGPSLVLGWGTPKTLVTITIGVLLELPSPLRIVLAGQLRMVLPDEDTQVAVINVDILGSLDLTNSRLEIDASLRNSRVAAFTIAGDMAVRASWGREPGFLMSAGGFNPRFKPPGNIRKLERLSICVGTSDNPRLRLEAYLAVTSNTVQFGTRLDLYAFANLGIGKFSVAAMIGFDALIHFSPFSFVVDIFASVVLRWDDDPFLGISLAFTLSGPQPWHAIGEATFDFLGRHTFQFELTVGEQPAAQPPEVVDVLDKLGKALADPRNWETQYPADSRRSIVTLRARAPEERGNGVVVHPLGSLTVRQNVVPLSFDITRYGTGRPKDATRFELALRTVDGAVRPPDSTVLAPFARPLFVDMTDPERLSAPSFDQMIAGGTFSGGDLLLPVDGIQQLEYLEYDEKLIDKDQSSPADKTPYVLSQEVLLRTIGGGAAARNGASGTPKALLLGEPVEIATRPLKYQVVKGMTPISGSEPTPSYGRAVADMQAMIVEDPELAERLVVVGAHEMSG